MIECEVVFYGSVIHLNNFRIMLDEDHTKLYECYHNDNPIEDMCSFHSMEEAIKYCLEQS